MATDGCLKRLGVPPKSAAPADDELGAEAMTRHATPSYFMRNDFKRTITVPDLRMIESTPSPGYENRMLWQKFGV